MLFTVLISCFIIGTAFMIDITNSKIVNKMTQDFGRNFVNELHIFVNADDKTKITFCDNSADDFL